MLTDDQRTAVLARLMDGSWGWPCGKRALHAAVVAADEALEADGAAEVAAYAAIEHEAETAAAVNPACACGVASAARIAAAVVVARTPPPPPAEPEPSEVEVLAARVAELEAEVKTLKGGA